jgi:hypothetical protein
MAPQRFSIVLGIFVIALSAASCSSSSSSDEGIGPNGGTVQLSAGGSLDIPAGALSSTVDIAAEEIPAPDMSMALPGGPFYEVSPHGLTFSKGVTLTLPFEVPDDSPDALNELAIIVAHSPNVYELVPGVVDLEASTISAPIYEFSLLGLGFVEVLPCNNPSDCEIAAFPNQCLENQVWGWYCADDHICRMKILEDCSADDKICRGGACGAGECTSFLMCPGQGEPYCEGYMVRVSDCADDDKCHILTEVNCATSGLVCVDEECVQETNCGSKYECPYHGAAHCEGNTIVQWGCNDDNYQCVKSTGQNCAAIDKVCRLGACVAP